MRALLYRLATWLAREGIVIGVMLFILAIAAEPLWRVLLRGGS